VILLNAKRPDREQLFSELFDQFDEPLRQINPQVKQGTYRTIGQRFAAQSRILFVTKASTVPRPSLIASAKSDGNCLTSLSVV